MITISEDQNEVTVQPVKAVRLRFVESKIGDSCVRCAALNTRECGVLPCIEDSRNDRKNGHFVEVSE